jgi:positive phototaxis protein PixI
MLAKASSSIERESDPNAIAAADTEKYLRFRLGSQDSALLPVLPIVEITPLRVKEILPVPQMPSYVLGIHNWRGEMLWLVDLGHLLGMPPLFRSRQQADMAMAIVVQSDDRTIGLVVDRVADIEPYPQSILQPPDPQLFPAQQLPYLQGFFIQEPQEVLTVLDVAAIFQVPQWRSLI